jgi:hypothetical protein
MHTPDLIVPGRHDHERRVFHHTLEAAEQTGVDTTANFFMDRQLVGAAPFTTPNPGFAIPCVATHVFTDFITGGHTVAGNWTLRLRKNEAAVDSATFVILAGAVPGAHIKSCGLWSQEVQFDACDTYHIQADGPEKAVVLIRAILRFEELS